MNKRYIPPVISFEELEDEVMINKYSTTTVNKVESPDETIKNDIKISDERLTDSETWDDWDNDD